MGEERARLGPKGNKIHFKKNSFFAKLFLSGEQDFLQSLLVAWQLGFLYDLNRQDAMLN